MELSGHLQKRWESAEKSNSKILWFCPQFMDDAVVESSDGFLHKQSTITTHTQCTHCGCRHTWISLSFSKL